jgi:XRE family transcriptional regulator of biofilm formation
MTISLTLRHLRAESGLSLQQLAEKVNCSKAHLWSIEKGAATNPTVELVQKMAEVFEVSVSRFFGEQIKTEDEEADALIRDYRTLKQKDKDFIKIAIKTFKEWGEKP